MKRDFSEFLKLHNTEDIKDGALFSLSDFPVTEKQKEFLSAMSYGVALNLLEQYHEWVNSCED